MDASRMGDWVKQHRWWVALVLVIIVGYSFGKDLALRDNQRSVAAHAGPGR